MTKSELVYFLVFVLNYYNYVLLILTDSSAVNWKNMCNIKNVFLSIFFGQKQERQNKKIKTADSQ